MKYPDWCRPASREPDQFRLGPAVAFGSIGGLDQVQECGARDNAYSSELSQREQMALIPGDDELRFRGQRALQKHFIVWIRGCAPGPFRGKHQVSRGSEGLDPRDPLFLRVARR